MPDFIMLAKGIIVVLVSDGPRKRLDRADAAKDKLDCLVSAYYLSSTRGVDVAPTRFENLNIHIDIGFMV